MKDYYKRLISISNIFPPFIMVALLFVSLFDVEAVFLEWLSIHFGMSTISVIVFMAFYFSPKHRFCLFTKCVVIGIAANHFLYLIRPLLNYDQYSSLFTISCFVFSITAWLILIFKK